MFEINVKDSKTDETTIILNKDYLLGQPQTKKEIQELYNEIDNIISEINKNISKENPITRNGDVIHFSIISILFDYLKYYVK